MPGALLVGIGVQAFYQFATWFLAPKLANATELYGLLGIAATALFWLYILGRLMIGAVTLNASVREQRIATSPLPQASSHLPDQRGRADECAEPCRRVSFLAPVGRWLT